MRPSWQRPSRPEELETSAVFSFVCVFIALEPFLLESIRSGCTTLLGSTYCNLPCGHITLKQRRSNVDSS